MLCITYEPPPDGGVGHDYDVNILLGDNMGSEKWALFCDIDSKTYSFRPKAEKKN